MSYELTSDRLDSYGIAVVIDGSTGGDTRGASVPPLDEPNALSLWVRPPESGIDGFFEDQTPKFLFDAGTDNNQGSGNAYCAYFTEVSGTQLLSVIMGGIQSTFDVSGLLSAGEWSHVAIGFDPDDETVRLWVDGEEVDQFASVGSWSAEPTYGTNGFYFRNFNGSEEGPVGHVAEIAWFRGYSMASAAGSLAEFRILVSSLAAGGSPMEGNWIRYWPLSDDEHALYRCFGNPMIPIVASLSEEHPIVTSATDWIIENACVGMDRAYDWAQAAKVRRVLRAIQTDSNGFRSNPDEGHWKMSELFLTELGGSASKKFIGANSNNGSGLANTGDSYSAASHQITPGGSQVDSPLHALMPNLYTLFSYRYYGDGEAADTGNFGVGAFFYSTDAPAAHDGLDDEQEFIFVAWLGHHSTPGIVRVGSREAGSPYGTILSTQVITVDARDDEVVPHEFTIPSGSGRNGLGVYVLQRNISDAVEGEVTVFGQTLETLSQTGVCECSWPNFGGDGVWEYFNLISAWGATPAGFQWDIAEHASKRYDEDEDPGPMLFIINTGTNDRNFSNTSRDGVNASNTRLGHAADIDAFIELIRSYWIASGRDINRLTFGLCPTHLMSEGSEAADEDTTGAVRAMRAGQRDVALARTDTFFLNTAAVNNQELATYDDQHDAGGSAHCNRTGYEAFWAITNNVIASAPAPVVPGSAGFARPFYVLINPEDLDDIINGEADS